MFLSPGRLTLLVVFIFGSALSSGANVQSDEFWSEGGLRVAGKSLQLGLSGEHLARVRLSSAKTEITVEATSFFVMRADPSGMVVKSMGPATVTASDGRRMYADTIEVWLSSDGWGYFKATRRVVRR